MYGANLLLGLRPLPQLLNQTDPLAHARLCLRVPDRLRSSTAGKVVEEIGLIVAMVVGLGVLGSGWAAGVGPVAHAVPGPWLRRRRLGGRERDPAAALWRSGFLGLNDGPRPPRIILGPPCSPSTESCPPARRRTRPERRQGRLRQAAALERRTGRNRWWSAWDSLRGGWFRTGIARIFKPAGGGPSRAISRADNRLATSYVVSRTSPDPSVEAHSWALTVGGSRAEAAAALVIRAGER